MQSPSPGVPSVLARYPSEVQAAFVRFTADGNQADLNLLVHAALRDFIPKDKSRAAPAVLGGELRLVEDLGLDSLAVAEMIFFFEDLFQVSIPTGEILGLKTVGDLELYVRGKLDGKKLPA